MTKLQLSLAAVATSLLFSGVAFAESIAEKRHHKEQEEWLAKANESMNKACETKIPSTFDWASFKEADMGAYSENGRCQAVENAIESLCGEKDAKPEIQKKVKKIVCHFGGKEADKRKITLKNGTVDWYVGLGSANEGAFLNEWFLKNL